MVQRLLAAGEDVELANESGHRPIHVATRLDDARVLEILIAAGAKLDASESNAAGALPLHVAAKSNCTEALALLLRSGANPLQLDNYGRLALAVAIQSGAVEATEILWPLSLPALQDFDNQSKTLLHFAALGKEPRFIEELLNNGLNAFAVDSEGKTALHYAAVVGNVRAIRAICSRAGRGIIDRQDRTGQTALHRAAFKGRDNAVRVLIELGADIEIEDSEGHKPADVAKSGFVSIAPAATLVPVTKPERQETIPESDESVVSLPAEPRRRVGGAILSACSQLLTAVVFLLMAATLFVSFRNSQEHGQATAEGVLPDSAVLPAGIPSEPSMETVSSGMQGAPVATPLLAFPEVVVRWRFGSADELHLTNGKFARPADVLQDETQGLCGARAIIVIATASREGAVDFNARLARQRGETIARALSPRLARCLEAGERRLFILNLGASVDLRAGAGARLSAVVGLSMSAEPSADRVWCWLQQHRSEIAGFLSGYSPESFAMFDLRDFGGGNSAPPPDIPQCHSQ
jgi:ankyrin repeat protein